MITTVLFDLDGTLLPMNNDEFVKYYFSFLCKKLAPHGYEAKSLVDSIWAGTGAMVKNDGSRTNEEAFWDKFQSIWGDKALEHKSLFEDFYANEFDNAKAVCGYDEGLVSIVGSLKKKGIKVALATNPVFPSIATEKRIDWAGFKPDDFELFTVYENIGYCKPNPDYYLEVARRLNADPSECLMVGNDVKEDLQAASSVGMDVFLLTNNIINRDNFDYSSYNYGNTNDLMSFLSNNKMI